MRVKEMRIIPRTKICQEAKTVYLAEKCAAPYRLAQNKEKEKEEENYNTHFAR